MKLSYGKHLLYILSLGLLSGCGGIDSFDFDDPLKNKQILFFMGQQNNAVISDYRDLLESDSDLPEPGGITTYTSLTLQPDGSIVPGFEPLSGVITPQTSFGYESFLPDMLQEFPDTAVSLGLFLSDFAHPEPYRCSNHILYSLAGEMTPGVETEHLIPLYQGYFDDLVTYLKATDRHIFLRIGNEVDIFNNCIKPEALRAAFKYIKTRLDEREAHKIHTVWSLTGYGFGGETVPGFEQYNIARDDYYDLWYPGDEWVDWIAMSTFYTDKSLDIQWQYLPEFLEPLYVRSPREEQIRIVEFARKQNKPVFIAEAAPQAMQTDDLTVSSIYTREETSKTADEIWELWYATWFKFIEDNRDVIKAVAYINNNWDEEFFWHCDPGLSAGEPNCIAGYWGDTRIQGNPVIYENFKAELQKPIYINGHLPFDILH